MTRKHEKVFSVINPTLKSVSERKVSHKALSKIHQIDSCFWFLRSFIIKQFVFLTGNSSTLFRIRTLLAASTPTLHKSSHLFQLINGRCGCDFADMHAKTFGLPKTFG